MSADCRICEGVDPCPKGHTLCWKANNPLLPMTIKHPEIEQKKSIEWATASINPITGCNGPGGKRCDFCYAWRIAQRFRGRNGFPEDDPFKPTYHHQRINEIYRRGKPTSWFMGSMCDWMDDGVEDRWIDDCLSAMWRNPRHVFVTLTKQHWNLSRLMPFGRPGFDQNGVKRKWMLPQNLIVGVSVTNSTQIEGIKTLHDFPAGCVKAISFEPLMEDIAGAIGYRKLRDVFDDTNLGSMEPQYKELTGIDWVFIGGCSKQSAMKDAPAIPEFKPPHEWVLTLASLAKASGCKVFIKPNAGYPLTVQQYPDVVKRVLEGLPALSRCPECGTPYSNYTWQKADNCQKCGWPEAYL